MAALNDGIYRVERRWLCWTTSTKTNLNSTTMIRVALIVAAIFSPKATIGIVPTTARTKTMSAKACNGAPTISVWQNMEECAECGTRVRWDCVDDPFFGFQNCDECTRAVDAVDPSAAKPGKPTTRVTTSSSSDIC